MCLPMPIVGYDMNLRQATGRLKIINFVINCKPIVCETLFGSQPQVLFVDLAAYLIGSQYNAYFAARFV